VVVWDAGSLRRVPRGLLTIDRRPTAVFGSNGPITLAAKWCTSAYCGKSCMLRAMRRELETGLRDSYRARRGNRQTQPRSRLRITAPVRPYQVLCAFHGLGVL
jgi:hypothetical protein